MPGHEHKFDVFDQPDPRAPRLHVCRCGAAYPEPRPKAAPHDRAIWRRPTYRPQSNPNQYLALIVVATLALVVLAYFVLSSVLPRYLPDSPIPYLPYRPQDGYLTPTPVLNP